MPSQDKMVLVDEPQSVNVSGRPGSAKSGITAKATEMTTPMVDSDILRGYFAAAQKGITLSS